VATWPEAVDNTEKCKRMMDLFLVSVLLDAGAGTKWSYKSPENGRIYRRSEGIAVATLDMFKTVSHPSNSQPAYIPRTLTTITGAVLWEQEQQAPGRQGGPGAVDRGAARPRAAVATRE
jgi:hypothetical protein